MALSETIRRLRNGLTPIELIYSSAPAWPLPHPRPVNMKALQIAVLDSSFNPPTLAHLALANHPRPKYEYSSGDYDAKLLLLSIRNADKKLKTSDATYEHRAEMMIELAKDVTNSDGSPGNVAVAMIDEPTFVGKSKILQMFLMKRLNELESLEPALEPKLTFLLGIDTLYRLFSPRYYSNSEEDRFSKMRSALRQFFVGDDSRVVSASRDASSYPSNNESSSESYLMSQIQSFLTDCSISSEYVSIIHIGDNLSRLSSSNVRELVAKNVEDWKPMVSTRVADYVTKEGLYKSD